MALADVEVILLHDYLSARLQGGARAGSCLTHRRIWMAVPVRILGDGLEQVIPCQGCEDEGLETPVD